MNSFQEVPIKFLYIGMLFQSIKYLPYKALNWTHCMFVHSENTSPCLFPSPPCFHIDQSTSESTKSNLFIMAKHTLLEKLLT